MGYVKNWNVDDIVRQLNSAYWNCTDPRQDGFTTWGVKQDLYQIKFILDDLLKRCPEFAPEKEWLREQEKKKIIKVLSNDIQ
jgi:hypothetical protein